MGLYPTKPRMTQTQWSCGHSECNGLKKQAYQGLLSAYTSTQSQDSLHTSIWKAEDQQIPKRTAKVCK